MLENVSYKKKNQLLLIAVVLILLAVYNFALKKTLLAYNDWSVAKEQMVLAENAPEMASKLEKELMQMDEKIGSGNEQEKDPEQGLLGLVTNYCQNNHVVLREFPEKIITDQEKLTVETNAFIVEGDFSSLINLVYILEQRSKIGKVASVRYQLKKDIKSKKMVLTAAIYLQNVKKKENEK